MKKLIICQGIPCSGKSTWAKQFVLDNPDYVRVCRDDLRLMRGEYWLPEQEGLITEWEHECIVHAICSGYSVVVDATNLNPKTIDTLCNLVSGWVLNNSLEIEFKMFHVQLQEALRRDSLRLNPVGEKVISDFYNKYVAKKGTTEFKVEKIIQDSKLPKAIIVDLDGTLCLHNGRGPFEYPKCDTDLPNEAVVTVVKKFCYDKHHILFLSGREDSCRDKTTKWLIKNGLCDYRDLPQLFMRKTGDHRKDCIIKKEIFDAEIRDKYYVEFCLDDRDQVVKLWRGMGLTCLQVAEGNF